MAKYGVAAVRATQLLRRRRAVSPVEAWERAVREVFPGSPSAQAKGCPRGAYLGLCEDGFERGVDPGSYTRSVLNKRYAVRAANVLRERPELLGDESALWRHAVRGEEKAPNGQMEIVIALRRANLLEA